jgi:hypothetical protein
LSVGNTDETEAAPSHLGRIAVFEYDAVFANSPMRVRSYLYMFPYVNEKWTIKYRVTHPSRLDLTSEVESFISSFR